MYGQLYGQLRCCWNAVHDVYMHVHTRVRVLSLVGNTVQGGILHKGARWRNLWIDTRDMFHDPTSCVQRINNNDA